MNRRPRQDFTVSPLGGEKTHLNMLRRALRAVERDVDRLLEEKRIAQRTTWTRGESKEVVSEDEALDRRSSAGSRFRQASGTPVVASDFDSDSESDSEWRPDSRFRQASGIPEIVEPNSQHRQHNYENNKR